MNEVLPLLSLSVSNSGNPVTPTVTLDTTKPGLNRYKINIPINSPGTYTISSTKLSKYANSVTFYVRPGQPDAKSQCSLDGYTSSPVLQTKTTITYSCTLIDSLGFKLDAVWAQKKYSLDYSCNMVKVKPVGMTKDTINASQVTVQPEKFTCTFNPTISGDYQLEGIVRGAKQISLTPQINSFSYYTLPPNLEGQVYDFTTQSWVDFTKIISVRCLVNY
jgi:hypothetical protein